jgi:hypothetical protein
MREQLESESRRQEEEIGKPRDLAMERQVELEK